MNPIVIGGALALCYGLAVVGVMLIRDPGVAERFDLDAPIDARGRRVGDSPLTRLYERAQRRVAPTVMGLVGDSRLERVRHRIDAAGRPHGVTVEGYAGRKGILTLLLGLTAVPLVTAADLPAFLLALPVLGWFLVDISLKQQAQERQEAIERSLPDFLDVLAVTVSAGMSFRPALARVAAAFPGPLGDEITTALRQMSLGMTRREALEQLRSRNDSDQLSEFVTALLQAEELGAPLTDTLRDIAADMRRAWEQEARRKAAKAAPRISVIVSVTLVPAAAILILVGLFTASDLGLGELFGG